MSEKRPLADEIRPLTLDEVVGQKHLLGKGALLRRLIESGSSANMIFYGPSGTGKTTIANIIVCRWGMGALGASTDLNSRMAWLQAGLDGPMYDATVENLTHSWQMLGLISVVCLVAAWLVLQIAFDKKKA